METFHLKCGDLEYYDDEHVYLFEGLILPSVTEIIGKKFNDYADVPKQVLNRAAERGTKVHKQIENFCKSGVDDGSTAIRHFKFLQNQYNFEVLDNELPLVIFKDDIPVACGRLDMTIEMDGRVGIADIKTCSALNKPKIAYQLNMYRLGLMQSYGVQAEFLKIIHIRDDKRKFIDMPINEEETYKLIDEYTKKLTN
jgi:hypothetical protein